MDELVFLHCQDLQMCPYIVGTKSMHQLTSFRNPSQTVGISENEVRHAWSLNAQWAVCTFWDAPNNFLNRQCKPRELLQFPEARSHSFHTSAAALLLQQHMIHTNLYRPSQPLQYYIKLAAATVKTSNWQIWTLFRWWGILWWMCQRISLFFTSGETPASFPAGNNSGGMISWTRRCYIISGTYFTFYK